MPSESEHARDDDKNSDYNEGGNDENGPRRQQQRSYGWCPWYDCCVTFYHVLLCNWYWDNAETLRLDEGLDLPWFAAPTA